MSRPVVPTMVVDPVQTLVSSGVQQPGLWRSDPYLERYQIPGGGTVIFTLYPEDKLTVSDPEGRQPAEIVTFGANGNSDPGALTNAKTQPAEGLRTILAGTEQSASCVRAGMERYGFNLADAQAIRLFASDSPAGEEVNFSVEREVTCVVCAPGTPMVVDEQDPPTSLYAWVRRSEQKILSEPRLPEPLADPRLDFRIEKCTASSFEIREGEFIQIIDVFGRECSDFLAFDRRSLDKGLERGMDMTATRTLMGGGIPRPGPLLEILRSGYATVGRSCPGHRWAS